MLGFAAVDRRSETVAIWLVSRTDPTEASSTNAVVVDLADENARRKVHSLTCDRIVVATPGSDLAGLPVSGGHPASLLEEFIDATRAHQLAIVSAVRSYAASRKGQKLVEPAFPAVPLLPDDWPEAPVERTLELAHLLERAWTNWLVSDSERLRRTTQPRTGKTPWIMPEELNQPELLPLPPALAEKLIPEPVGPFPG